MAWASRTRGLVTERILRPVCRRARRSAPTARRATPGALRRTAPTGAREREGGRQHEAAAEIQRAIALSFFAQPLDAVSEREEVRKLLRARQRRGVARRDSCRRCSAVRRRIAHARCDAGRIDVVVAIEIPQRQRERGIARAMRDAAPNTASLASRFSVSRIAANS